MRRRPDIPDQILERWASWRLNSLTEIGTGPCALVRFREPAGTALAGSRSLYLGRSCPAMAALNAHLVSQLGREKVSLLLALYGLPGDDYPKIRALGISQNGVKRLRKTARTIARYHIPSSVMGDHRHDSDPCQPDTQRKHPRSTTDDPRPGVAA